MFVHPGYQGAQDGMREARLCQCCADILQSGRLDSSTRRAEDEPLMLGASCCSSSCVELLKFLFPEFNVTPSASVQRSTELGLDLDPTPISEERELPRTKTQREQVSLPRGRGSNVPCIAGGCVLTISDDDPGEE